MTTLNADKDLCFFPPFSHLMYHPLPPPPLPPPPPPPFTCLDSWELSPNVLFYHSFSPLYLSLSLSLSCVNIICLSPLDSESFAHTVFFSDMGRNQDTSRSQIQPKKCAVPFPGWAPASTMVLSFWHVLTHWSGWSLDFSSPFCVCCCVSHCLDVFVLTLSLYTFCLSLCVCVCQNMLIFHTHTHTHTQTHTRARACVCVWEHYIPCLSPGVDL